jgi:hypothetical protein
LIYSVHGEVDAHTTGSDRIRKEAENAGRGTGVRANAIRTGLSELPVGPSAPVSWESTEAIECTCQFSSWATWERRLSRPQRQMLRSLPTWLRRLQPGRGVQGPRPFSQTVKPTTLSTSWTETLCLGPLQQEASPLTVLFWWVPHSFTDLVSHSSLMALWAQAF